MRAGGLEPPQAFRPYGFSYHFGFRRRPVVPGVRGLDYPFTVPRRGPGVRCCPSSLYTFPLSGLARDRHLTGFPEFEQFCIAGFPASTQGWLKSVASTNFATPASQAFLYKAADSPPSAEMGMLRLGDQWLNLEHLTDRIAKGFEQRAIVDEPMTKRTRQFQLNPGGGPSAIADVGRFEARKLLRRRCLKSGRS